jgi:hypothetical protein
VGEAFWDKPAAVIDLDAIDDVTSEESSFGSIVMTRHHSRNLSA